MRECCAPSADRRIDRPGARGTGGPHPATLVWVPGGSFVMGDESDWSYPGDGEGPAHEVVIRDFAIDAHAVTNEMFSAFVDATGHVTGAEHFGESFVFGGLLP